MSFSIERLYSLLPAVHRIRDEEDQDASFMASFFSLDAGMPSPIT
jgi:hypothetical protein